MVRRVTGRAGGAAGNPRGRSIVINVSVFAHRAPRSVCTFAS
jgi:hypothetical protein